VIPTQLADWTLEAIRALADSGPMENDVYDFKADLQAAEHQRKAVAAFANTRGGFLVFGVSNDRQLTGVAKSELPRDFGSKLTHGLSPSVSLRFAAPLRAGDDRIVWVCEVPRSQRGPHGVLVNDHWVFPRRTETGSNVSMNVEEVRSGFAESNLRRSKLRFLRGEFKRLNDRARDVIRADQEDRDQITIAYGSGLMEAHLPELFDLIVRDSAMLVAVNQVREAARDADDALARFHAIAAVDGVNGSGGPWYDYVKRAKGSAQRIVPFTRHVLDAWKEDA
jgi:hypothetical protein